MGLNAVIKGLESDTRYVFLVRAENSAGLSAPSGLSSEVRTPSSVSRDDQAFGMYKMLDKCAVKIVKAKAEGVSTVRLTWEVRIAERAVIC